MNDLLGGMAERLLTFLLIYMLAALRLLVWQAIPFAVYYRHANRRSKRAVAQ